MEFPSRDRLTLGLFVFGLVSVSVRAQEFRARVQGAVMDSTQAVVVGATVSLSNLKTGVQAVRVTNETGRYRFDFVGPGSYTIKVEAPGFSRFSQENAQLWPTSPSIQGSNRVRFRSSSTSLTPQSRIRVATR